MKAMSGCLCACLCLWFSVAARAQPADTAAVYASWRDRIVQIQVIDRQAGTKAGIGSGFFAGSRGLIVTNYHVIAGLVNEPGRYLARFLAEHGQEGELALLAVDAVHDLAVLAAPRLDRVGLGLAAASPPQGTRLWSLGYPFDIGLTIVEGTYNGVLEKSLYEKLHFTGSINPGMSGGPTLDAAGEVVGVNVATAGNQVSFLVPVRFVRALLDGAGSEPATEADLNRQVAAQLLANQERVVQRLLDGPLPVTRLEGYSVPADLAAFVNCWGNSEEDEENNLALVYYRCQTNDDIYLSASVSTGIIRYQHDLLSTGTLGAMRFYGQLQKRSHFPRLQLGGDDRSMTNYACRSDFVEHGGLPLKLSFCARAYRKLEGLYDAYLNVTSLVDDQEALQSTLLLAGFSWDNLTRFAGRFLEAYRWQD